MTEPSIPGCEYSDRILCSWQVGVKVGLKEVRIVGNGSITLREFVYVRRDASSRAFSRWRMRCALPIRLSYHPGLVEGSIFSRPGVLPTVPSEIFGEGRVKATESHLTTAHFWAINEFT